MSIKQLIAEMAMNNLEEAVAKIACLKCDEVSTAASWKKKGGFCPKCKVSNQGVAESTDLTEMRTPFIVIDTADDNKVVAKASDEQGAKRSIASSERPPMSIKNKSTLKIVKSAKKQDIGYPLKEETELDEVFAKDYSGMLGSFKKTVEKAEAAHAKGNSKMKDYHLDNARNRLMGMKSTDTAKLKNSDHYDRYKKMKGMKESVDLTEDAHNDLNDIIFDFQKKIMRFGRSNLDAKIAKKLKEVDNELDDLRADLFKIRPGR